MCGLSVVEFRYLVDASLNEALWNTWNDDDFHELTEFALFIEMPRCIVCKSI